MGCVMVAGGAGYIGSHAVRELRRAGRCVAVLDNLSTGHRAAVEGAEFLEADIRDTDAVYEALKAYEAEAVMHFAADSRVGESQVDPEKYYGNNVCGTFSLLSAMRRAGVNRLVFSSTAAVYGDAKGLITEEYPKRPANVYGRTKWMIEQMLADFDAAYGLKAVALRYFNAAGADPEGGIGEDHRPETHLIPLVLRAAVNREPLTVFGDDYPTRDGTCVRDYIHVEDLVEAHVRVMEALEPGDARVYNLGIGRGYSVREIIDAAERVVGMPLTGARGPRRPGDPPSLYADASKIERELGWRARRTDIEEIIRSAYRWFQEHPRGYESSRSK